MLDGLGSGLLIEALVCVSGSVRFAGATASLYLLQGSR